MTYSKRASKVKPRLEDNSRDHIGVPLLASKHATRPWKATAHTILPSNTGGLATSAIRSNSVAPRGSVTADSQINLPALTVRHSGSLQALGGEVALLGMSGGRLGVLNLASGELIWESAVTLPRGATELERIADVASPPVFDGNMVCAVAFQGRVACLDAKSGTPLWSRELSSSRGLTFDARLLYVTADDGTVHAFDRYSGTPMWKQEGLRYRGVSAPALLNGQVLVYDAEGYAHLLSSLDGSLVGRLATGGNELQGRPLNVSAQRV